MLEMEVNRSREIIEMDVDSSQGERKGLCYGYGVQITKKTVMKKKRLKNPN